ncbi:uncharacterized protein LOC105254013 isoform X2 [Camponotus floridanus]|uniref:uncharacterized protein LOC105254013 isoform X2 n=1 Tax=Camponotus floridanus TaxID=104421 RepID=UPI00059CD462|nr:uncharacterized protein LOC105254013 isoform X2 [Camponotus floridanus]
MKEQEKMNKGNENNDPLDASCDGEAIISPSPLLGGIKNLIDRRTLALETHMRTPRTIREQSDKRQFPRLLCNVKAERCSTSDDVSTGTNHKLRRRGAVAQSSCRQKACFASDLCGDGCHEEIRNRRGAALESGRRECPLAY